MELQIPQKRLDEASSFRSLLREDPRRLLERPFAEGVVVREYDELDVAVAAVVNEIHQVDEFPFECLDTLASNPARSRACIPFCNQEWTVEQGQH